jgi:hypothetical protein
MRHGDVVIVRVGVMDNNERYKDRIECIFLALLQKCRWKKEMKGRKDPLIYND